MRLFHDDALLGLPIPLGLLPGLVFVEDLVTWCAGEEVEEGGLGGD